MEHRKESLETLIVHGDHKLDPLTGSIAPPIYPASTFAFKSTQHGAELFINHRKGYYYTRVANPTINQMCTRMALLEGGETALAFASGMAAIHAVFIALAGAGDSLLLSDTIYGGTYALCSNVLPKIGIEPIWVDTTDLETIKRGIAKNTRGIFIETPANPTLKVIDIAGAAEIAHSRGIPLIVDNTFPTPYLQRPLELGADIVIHSATKYLGGHGDLVGGLVVGSEEVYQKVHPILSNVGGCMSPFNAWLIIRGLKTLHIRMERHCQNALEVARFLEGHRAVETVWYPGLPGHPQHELAKRQMDNFGGMVAFEVKGGKEAGRRVMDSVHICTLAVSLGDVDTLIQHPASMTHSTYSEEALLATGITPGLIRISVGLEKANDIIDDLRDALDKI